MKRVRCMTSVPLRMSGVEVIWADVWLRYKGKPGRKVYWLSPCLEAAADIDRELEIYAECAREYPDSDYSEEIRHIEEIREKLKQADFVISGEGACLSVYTSKDMIDRAEAERMLRWLLAENGIRRTKLQWNKPKIYCWPA